MRVLYYNDELKNLKDPVFLAGPTHRSDNGSVKIKNTLWRENFIELFKKFGFDGDILMPEVKPGTYYKYDLNTIVDWEVRGLYYSSRIIFCIPRSKELIGLTTNIEFGEFMYSDKIYPCFPEGSIKNEYLKVRLNKLGIPFFIKEEDVVKEYLNYLAKPSKMIFTSDTHFSSDRTFKFSLRPYHNIDEMDLKLISSINRVLRQKDTLVHLGDFGNSKVMEYLNIGNKIKFLKGNYERDDPKKFKEDMVDKYSDKLDILDDYNENYIELIKDNDSQILYLTHEPLLGKGPEDAIWLYGHIHGRNFAKYNGIDVGIDYLQRPFTEEDIWFFINVIRNNYWDENVYCKYVGINNDKKLKEIITNYFKNYRN